MSTKEITQQSSVKRVARSKIPKSTTLALYVAAGGRCEFDSCTKNVVEHSVTKTTGNFAEQAHIVAFQERGPRGVSRRKGSIHALDNLMLLCRECHTLVDNDSEKYTVEVLKKYKSSHEAHVAHLMQLLPKNFTTVVVFQAPIGEEIPAIGQEQIRRAIAPAYPDNSIPYSIDLTSLKADGNDLIRAAMPTIERDIARVLNPGLGKKRPDTISLFAIGPIPLLAFLGFCLGNKIKLDLYQRHRDTEEWEWKDVEPAVQFGFKRTRKGTDSQKAALTLSLSGHVRNSQLPTAVDSSFSVYEILLVDQTPSVTFLNCRDDLVLFKSTYHRALAQIAEAHPGLAEIHVIAAVPPPIAVLVGREPLQRAFADLIVYDYDLKTKGYHSPVRIKANEQ